MTETELGDVIALAVHEATRPLYAKIAILEARPQVAPDVLEMLKEFSADHRMRLIALEGRGPIVGPQGAKGLDGIGERGEKGDPGERGPEGQRGADGRDGKDIDLTALERLISVQVLKSIGALPLPQDGRDGKDANEDRIVERLTGLVVSEVAKEIALLPAPKDGKDGSSFLAGIGPPTTDGRAGDAYLDARTGDVYQCR